MENSNASLYTVNPASASTESATSSAVESEATKSSAVESSSAVETSSTSENSETSKEESLAALQDKTLAERTEVNDITDKDRDVIVTEKDGTVVKVQLHAPSYEDAESIDSKRGGYDSDAGLSVATPVRFQKALASIVGNLTINGKPAGRFGFKLADNGHADAYRAIIDKADSFLTTFLNAD